ncbi:restriction endonuclease subunit S [Methanorbis rubei]|uniref:Type I restriction modification DNA specificity domain-containing protein n=1 Tax=Methanorbis rubei TaxID=3028300 RepID=A0AAE4MFW7_9EURY|nr:hypothetical protein [Methanocorpusculaceae archaeon Cs1]
MKGVEKVERMNLTGGKKEKWPMVRLGDVCQIVSGSTPKTHVSEYWNGTVKWVTPAEIKIDSNYIHDTDRHLTEAGKLSASLQLIPKGTVLLTSRAPIGKVAIAGDDMYCNQGFKNLICSPKIYNRYLFYFLKKNTHYLNSLGNGATFKEISKKVVENILIPLPPLPEQQRIAAALDHVNSLIALRKAQITQLDMLVKARFGEMFGDPVRNFMQWDTLTLNELCDGIGDGLHGTPTYNENGNYPFINGNNLMDGKIVITESTKFVEKNEYNRLYIPIYQNAILISINGTLGRVAYYNNEEVVLGKSVCYCNLKNTVIKVFIYEIMMSDAFKEFLESASTKSTIKNVGLKAMREYRVILPPINLQEQFAGFVSQIDKSKFEIHNGLTQLKILKKSLMQEYFG